VMEITESPGVHLFLYGTLMRGCCGHHRVTNQTFIDNARTITGYRLYDLTGFPGLVVEDSDTVGVPGELWKVEADCLERLNRFEGTAVSLYQLAPIRLRPPFDRFEVLTYLYLHGIIGRDVVIGRWRESK